VLRALEGIGENSSRPRSARKQHCTCWHPGRRLADNEEQSQSHHTSTRFRREILRASHARYPGRWINRPGTARLRLRSTTTDARVESRDRHFSVSERANAVRAHTVCSQPRVCPYGAMRCTLTRSHHPRCCRTDRSRADLKARLTSCGFRASSSLGCLHRRNATIGPQVGQAPSREEFRISSDNRGRSNGLTACSLGSNRARGSPLTGAGEGSR
jgi:hypothetical protein